MNQAYIQTEINLSFQDVKLHATNDVARVIGAVLAIGFLLLVFKGIQS